MLLMRHRYTLNHI